MGQASSRTPGRSVAMRRTTAPGVSAAGPLSDSQSSDTPDPLPPHQSHTRPKRSHVASLRRSIAGLVSSGGGPSSDSEGAASSRRRSLLGSKRASRTSRRQSAPIAPVSEAETSESESAAGGSGSSRSPRRPWRFSRRWSKAPEPIPQEADEPLAGQPAALPAPGPSTEPAAIPIAETSTTLNSDPPRPADTASLPQVDAPTPVATDVPTLASANEVAPAPRTFPPAGTLVVVQGVVHTTDTDLAAPAYRNEEAEAADGHSRSRNSSVPRSTRGRISSRLSRPTSMALAPASSTDADAGSSTSSSEDFTTPPTSDGASSATPATTPPDSAIEPNSRPPPLSPSSIDVLGTLLSVAAAATAASLVTGSSAPLLSSGLANPAGSGPPAASVDDDATAPRRDPEAAPPSERRRTWGALRERLRNGRPPSIASSGRTLAPSPLPTETADEPVAEGALEPSRANANPVDARERMLLEMVRALNQGLGINSTTGPGHTIHSESGTATPAAQVAAPRALPGPSPPDGSFEQFLANLQTDLRRTLREGSDDSTPENANAFPGAHDDDELLRDLMGLAPTDDHVPPAANRDVRSTPTLHTISNTNSSLNVQRGVPEEPAADRASMDSVPSLETVSNTDHSGSDTYRSVLEFDDPHPGDDELREASSSSGQQAAESVATPPRSDSPAPGPAPAGGPSDRNINWWRMYRFPAMVAPQAQGAGAAPSPIATAPPAVPPAEPAPAAPVVPAPPVPETVVPVIVVGLQSVNVPRGDQPQPAGDAPAGADGAPVGGDAPAEGAPQRGRGWPYRAASALRGLRPGRRAEQRPADSPGARTFLIYVIGGYYPPNHRIVTGTGALDSFEALLELAELLGQVKPPTVTTEEINQSGLEVISPSKLAEYEATGKIASNCTERCLICLDDYEETNELRILGCKHGFHKDCVDRWMSTGRNNCPACRSQGVPVSSSPSEGATAVDATDRD